MKSRNFLHTIVFVVIAFLIFVLVSIMALISGCKYDVAEPQWDKPFTEPPATTISGIDPANGAAPGVNIITIRGENFANVSNANGVLFNAVPAEIVEKTNTLIRVRRPNLAAGDATVKVISSSSLTVAKISPFKLDPVIEAYGSFLDNLQLAIVTADNNENVYVVESVSKTVHKIDPSGNKTTLGVALRAPTEAAFGPDGSLYLLSNNRRVDRINITTGVISEWTQLPQGRIAKFGDFSDGYLFAGGLRTGLFIVPFDQPANTVLSGFYATDEILAVQVHEGYLYVASRESILPSKIWRHQIQAGGNLGSQELVYDMSAAPDTSLSSRIITEIAFSADGRMFISTDNSNPLLTYDPSSGTLDFFYKGILPPYCKYFYWGSMNYIYMLSGNNTPAQTWNIHRVNVGVTGDN